MAQPTATEQDAKPKPPIPQKVKDVELDGRFLTCWRGALIAAGTAGLAILLWINAWWWTGNATEYWLTAPPRLLIIIALVLGGCAWVRWLAREKVRRHWESPAEPGQGDGQGDVQNQDDQRPELIICCSGGGIKSASFCLGALQALNLRQDEKTSVYERADAVVGVSGGGYMAAAYASRQYDYYGVKRPFQPNSDEVDRLRRNTNYLASSGRVRFDLIASLFLGQLVNLAILIGAMCLLAWLIVDECSAVNLIDIDQATGQWAFNSGPLPLIGLLWMPALPFLAAIGFFLYTRFAGAWTRSRPSHRLFNRLLENRHTSSLIFGHQVSKTPNRLILISTILAILYPGVPYMAYQLHGLWSDRLQAWSIVSQPAAGLAAVITFVLSVRSAIKGTAPHQSNAFLAFVRRRVAPWLGVGIAFVVAYLVLVELTASFLSLAQAEQSPPTTLLWISAAGLLVARLFMSANNTSMFRFYRSRLHAAFFREDRPSAGENAPTSRSSEPDAEPRVFTLSELADQRPKLVLCATANIKDGDVLPSGRNGTTFILSDEIGFTDDGLPGADYRQRAAGYVPNGMLSDLDLATAAAISGAAVAPLDGRGNKALGAYRVLLALANIRLGYWVRNPYWTGDGLEFHGERSGVTTESRELDESLRSRFRNASDAADELEDRAVQLANRARSEKKGGAEPAQPANVSPKAETAVDPPKINYPSFISHPHGRRQLKEQWARLMQIAIRLTEAERKVNAISGPDWEERIGDRRILASRADNVANESRLLGERSRTCARRTGRRPWTIRFADFLDLTSPYQVVHEAFGSPSINSPYLYLTDGGHYDNLGLVEALRRYPKRIIMLDGSGDPEDEFPAMGDAIASARMDLGVEIEFNPAPLTRGEAKYPSSGWMRAKATYWTGVKNKDARAEAERVPDRAAHPVYIKESTCIIDYVKCVLPEGLSWDLESYRKRDPDFPTTSTKYELYDEFDFEAYRKLGWSLIMDAHEHDWILPTPYQLLPQDQDRAKRGDRHS